MKLFSRSESGSAAEQAAEKLLKKRGCKTLIRNYRVKEGEIDLIMREGETIVFVEVRARRSEKFGTPAESVTARKQQRIARAAHHYLQNEGAKLGERPLRFDVVGVRLDETGKPTQVEHIPDAFGAPGGHW